MRNAMAVETAAGGLATAEFAKPRPGRRIGLAYRTSSGRGPAYAELAAAVNADEPGNSYYRLFRTDERGTYKVLECYDNPAAVEAHRASSHFREIGARFGPWLAAAPEIERLAAV